MFPKHTVATSATIPPEKPPISTPTGQKQTAVVFMVDNTDIQVAVDNDRQWRIKRAAICACVFLLTILILVAGMLGAIAILSVHNDRLQISEPDPSNHGSLGNTLPTHRPRLTQRIKIDDGGLWLAEPVTPDLLDVEYVTDIHAADSYTAPATSSAVPPTSSSVSDSSSDYSSSTPDDYYLNNKNWVSSSFPYDGYYMRGGVGIPPWERSDWVGPSMEDPSTTDNSRLSEMSGDGGEVSGDGALSDQEYGDESGNGSGGEESKVSNMNPVISSAPNYYDDDSKFPDYSFSDYYFDS